MFYKVRVVAMDVAKWSPYEGAGDHLFSKGGYDVGNAKTVEEVKQLISDDLGYEPDDHDYDGSIVYGCRIENGDAYADDNGEFIVDYIYEVTEVKPAHIFG